MPFEAISQTNEIYLTFYTLVGKTINHLSDVSFAKR